MYIRPTRKERVNSTDAHDTTANRDARLNLRTSADRRWFELTDINWTAFEAVMDRPAIRKPRLSALLDPADPFID